MFIAHTNGNGEEQSVLTHSQNTARMCQQFGVEPWKSLLYTIGLLHDVGKYQDNFQARIQGANLYAPHSFCGAQEVAKRYGTGTVAMMMQYVIAGHHAGLPDCGTKADPESCSSLYGMLKRKGQSVAAYQQELSLPELSLQAMADTMGDGCRTVAEAAERFAFLTRYFYSCLTDADWLDTEAFCTGQKRHTLTADFPQCLQAVNQTLQSFPCKTPLQQARTRLQAQAFSKNTAQGQVFLLNMPTGSGKTLASLKWALEQAIASNKQRVIYIIPYNSIIDQTAEVFDAVLGTHATVLRHQSTYDFEAANEPEEIDTLALKQATENWDAQIILTTAVQFFESIYSNKRSKLRKLHNMAQSILVFDEAHLMPAEVLQPCLQAVTHITKFLSSQALFLTATMPDYGQLFAQLSEENVKIVPLISDRRDFAAFQKCCFQDLGVCSDQSLLIHSQAFASVLIVVNLRATAHGLFHLLGPGHRYHMSTYMTAVDRAATIQQIKQQLAALERDYPDLQQVPPERRICVVATSMIEAGVDLDFAAVYRQLWGLDSILQSGGRCNREGRRPNATTFIFQREAEAGKKQTDAACITQGLLQEFSDISSPACIAQYYERLLRVRQQQLTQHALGPRCKNPCCIPFAQYAMEFSMVQSQTVSLVVVEDEMAQKLVEEQKRDGKGTARALQSYTCSIYGYELAQLQQQGVIENVKGIYVLTNLDYYDKQTGIRMQGNDYYI